MSESIELFPDDGWGAGHAQVTEKDDRVVLNLDPHFLWGDYCIEVPMTREAARRIAEELRRVVGAIPRCPDCGVLEMEEVRVVEGRMLWRCPECSFYQLDPEQTS